MSKPKDSRGYLPALGKTGLAMLLVVGYLDHHYLDGASKVCVYRSEVGPLYHTVPADETCPAWIEREVDRGDR
jgi:hypothetical protein